jgi:hypothetical protein
MNTAGVRKQGFSRAFGSFSISRGLMFGILIVAALLAFEIFNYSTTDFALSDLLGDLSFAGLKWATILAIAFCGIDFAGIARLFTPEQGADEPREVWYLFGAWLLAATMNAMLTWWGVSIAILNHETLGNAVVERTTLLRIVPVFVAIMVWLIRILIIGTFSVAGDRLFSQADVNTRRRVRTGRSLGSQKRISNPRTVTSQSSFQPAPKASSQTDQNYGRPEPTYHPVAMQGYSKTNNQTRR